MISPVKKLCSFCIFLRFLPKKIARSWFSVPSENNTWVLEDYWGVVGSHQSSWITQELKIHLLFCCSPLNSQLFIPTSIYQTQAPEFKEIFWRKFHGICDHFYKPCQREHTWVVAWFVMPQCGFECFWFFLIGIVSSQFFRSSSLMYFQRVVVKLQASQHHGS